MIFCSARTLQQYQPDRSKIQRPDIFHLLELRGSIFVRSHRAVGIYHVKSTVNKARVLFYASTVAQAEPSNANTLL